MGSRASYVLIEGGAIAVYYSQWGGMSVPSVVIGGPDETHAYMRGLKPGQGLLDTTWGEGGILLDADTKTLIFFGGNHIESRSYLRYFFVRVLRQIWQGWSVSWATRGTLDFAEYPGVAQSLGLNPADLADGEVSAIWKPYPEEDMHNPHDQPCIGTVISVKWEDGRVADYTFYQYPHGYLTYGMALLDLLREREPDTPPHEDGDGSIERVPVGGAYADVASQTLWVWDGEMGGNPLYFEQIARAWPGWQVKPHADGLAQQIALSGRDPALVAVPQEQVIAELLEELLGEEKSTFDPNNIAQMILANSDPATTKFAPGFFQLDKPTMPADKRRATLLHAILQVVEDGETSPPAPLP